MSGAGAYYRPYTTGPMYYTEGPIVTGERLMPGSDEPVVRTSSYPPDNSTATITVRLPEPGPLTIDNYQVPMISDQHTYITSSIAPNGTRTITFTSPLMRGGVRETLTKKVTVKPGERVTVDLAAPRPKNPAK
jgi:uncharacterized protein (TIGR03000 family)